MNTGGPGVMTVGWIVVSFFSMPANSVALRSNQSDTLQHSSSRPAWPRSFPLSQRLVVRISGLTCYPHSSMPRSFPGSRAGKPRLHAAQSYLHFSHSTSSDFHMPQVQSTRTNSRYHGHRFWTCQPNLSDG